MNRHYQQRRIELERQQRTRKPLTVTGKRVRSTLVGLAAYLFFMAIGGKWGNAAAIGAALFCLWHIVGGIRYELHLRSEQSQ